MGDKPTYLLVAKEDPLSQAVLTLANIGVIEWSYGQQDESIDSTIRYTLQDQTLISLDYSTFMGHESLTGWINKKYQFSFMYKNFLGLKSRGFPSIKNFKEILTSRRRGDTHSVDIYVESALQRLVSELTKTS